MGRSIFAVLTAYTLLLLFVPSCDYVSLQGRSNDEVVSIPEYSGALKIWTGGDSITAAWESYRCRIWESMTEAGDEIDFVGTVHQETNQFNRNPDEDHDGHGGYTIAAWREEFSDTDNGNLEMMQEEDPDVLLLMLGTNDLAWWVPNDDIAQTTTDNMMSLVDQLFAWFPDMAIIVGTIPPMAEKAINATGRNRAEYAEQYRALLMNTVKSDARYGSSLFLADIFSTLTIDDLGDGIHPTSEGHDKMAVEWLKALSTYIKTRN